MTNIYQQKGYSDREAYLESLSEDYDCPMHIVEMTADLMGPEEDFDGLVSFLQDYQECGWAAMELE